MSNLNHFNNTLYNTLFLFYYIYLYIL